MEPLMIQNELLLSELAKNLDIHEGEMNEVLEDPYRFPVNPPVSYDQRLERLYDIARMVYVDKIADEDEMRIMIRLGIGLGFTPANVEFIIKKAMYLLSLNVNLETFKEEIKHMNR